MRPERARCEISTKPFKTHIPRCQARFFGSESLFEQV